MRSTTSTRRSHAALRQAMVVETLESRLLLAGGLGDTNPFGVNVWPDSQGLPTIAQAGVKWLRGFPEWQEVQPTSTTWNWAPVDSFLSNASANNLYVSGMFAFNVSWINSNTKTFPTNNMTAWSTYVSRLVTHVNHQVEYWEVWNEPDGNFAQGGTASDYANVVVSAYNAAKAADPDSQIGLAVSEVNLSYLEQVLNAGAADHFDYITVHPYASLGSVNSGQEAEFMSIVPTIRKVLAANNPAKINVPIQVTEVGASLDTDTVTAQAQALVKGYTMGIAQGFSRIDWYDAKGDGCPWDLFDSGGNIRPAYTALKNLTSSMGANPQYKGWVLLNSKDYGFVFQGATTSVMVTWAQPGMTDSVNFGQSVQILNPLTGSGSTSSTYSLTNAPILVVGVPSGLITQAQTNKSQPFPWNGNYTGANSVSLTMGDPNTESGLHQFFADSSSTAVNVYGSPARDCSKGGEQIFTVDPNFLSYTSTPIQISAVVRRNAANDNAGFNLVYESTTGWKRTGWNFIPGNDKWYTLTWTITDAQFVGIWGYNFKFDTGPYNKFYIQSLTVAKSIQSSNYSLSPQNATGSSLNASGTVNGTNVQIWQSLGTPNQAWTFTNMGGNVFKIQPSHAPGMVLDVTGGGSANGANVQLWQDNGSNAQRWAATSVPGGWTFSPLCAPGMVLDVSNGGNANGTNVQIWQANGTPAQTWKLTLKPTPYSGFAAALPGIVNFSNYDSGGEQIAYHDLELTNAGGAYRPSEGVDLEPANDTGYGNGYSVGWTSAGEWMKYTVNVAMAGTYMVSFRVASAASGGTFQLQNAAGANLTGTVTAPGTGGWQNWTTITAMLTLPSGVQTLTLFEDTGGYNLDCMTFARVPAAPSQVSVLVNDGSSQRSKVTSLTVSFDQPVTLGADAIALALRGGTIAFTTTIANPMGDGKTYLLSFSGTGIIGSSLPDGIYDLTVKAASVTDIYGQKLSGGDRTYTVHRIFGDINGDKTIDLTDSRLFRTALAGNYLPAFDFNSDGFVDLTDSRQFRLRIGVFMNY